MNTRKFLASVLVALIGYLGPAHAAALNPGDILVADYSALGGSGALFRVNPVSGAQLALASGGSFRDPAGVAIAPDGAIYVSDQNGGGTGGGKIFRIDPGTGAQTLVTSDLNLVNPEGLKAGSDGYLYVADINAFGGPGGIIRIDPTTGAQTAVSSGGLFDSPQDLALAPDGTIYVTDSYRAGAVGSVIRVDPTTGGQMLVASGGNFVNSLNMGITVLSNGDLVVTSLSSAKVVRVDPATGTQTVISAGQRLFHPKGVAVAADGSLLVADFDAFGGQGAIVHVNPTTGAQVVVSSNGSFADPLGIAVAAGAPVAFVVDSSTRTVETSRLSITFNASCPERIDRLAFKDLSFAQNLRGENLPLAQFHGQLIRGVWAGQGFVDPYTTLTQSWQVTYQDAEHLVVKIESRSQGETWYPVQNGIEPPVTTIYTFFVDQPYYMIDRTIRFSQSPQTTSYQVYVPRLYPASSFATYRYRTPTGVMRSGYYYGYGGCPSGCNFTDWDRKWAQNIDGNVALTAMYKGENRQDVSLVADWDDGSGTLNSWLSPMVPSATHATDTTFRMLLDFTTDPSNVAQVDADYAWFNSLPFGNAPVVTAPPVVSGAEGSLVTVSLTATDPDGEAIASLTADLSSLPAGNDAVFSPAASNTAGTLTWTPTFADAGAHTVTFTASNALSGTAVTQLMIQNVDRAPEVSAPPTAEADEGSQVTVVVNASDPDAEPLTTLAADLTGLPSGNDAQFAVNGANTMGILTWIPTFNDAGQYTITFTASNALSASAGTVLTIANVVQIGRVAGHVTADCPSAGTGLYGVTVDAFRVGAGDLVGTAVTDASGSFAMDSLSAGDYTVTVLSPLGYTAQAPELAVTVLGGQTSSAEFPLACATIVASPVGVGYWKHQVGVATGGKGKAQVSPGALCGYLDLIDAHFNSNAINPVVVYEPPASGECLEKLTLVKSLLNLPGSAAMINKARQELLSLLLNVAAGHLSLTQVVSADGATVSQAITYCDRQIDDPAGDYATARTIGEHINSAEIVPAGEIPLSTEQIAYRGPARITDFGVQPNPGSAGRVFRFAMSAPGSVQLRVFDIAGRLVAEVQRGILGPGTHAVDWDGRSSSGSRVGAGVYFARLRTGADTRVLKVMQVNR